MESIEFVERDGGTKGDPVVFWFRVGEDVWGIEGGSHELIDSDGIPMDCPEECLPFDVRKALLTATELLEGES